MPDQGSDQLRTSGATFTIELLELTGNHLERTQQNARGKNSEQAVSANDYAEYILAHSAFDRS